MLPGMFLLLDRVRGPGGLYRMALTPRGLLRLSLPGASASGFEAEVEASLHLAAGGGAPAEGEAEAHRARFLRLLRDWGPEVAWHCYSFPPPLDLRGSPFRLRVWKALRGIPPGRTLTYGELARRSGAPGAARAVGTAMKKNPAPLFVPCHRVLSSSGPGGFGAGPRMKALLLDLDGSDPEAG